MQVVGELPVKPGRAGTCAKLVLVTLGLTASVFASPTVKREIAGVPDASAKKHWFQIGKASWYGGTFNGRTTANGEKYDMYAMTCAHRTLPLGTWLRVTNLNNKRTVYVRVNDRGPVAKVLIADLSRGAAQRLGFDGLAKVSLEVVPPSDPGLIEQIVTDHGIGPVPARDERLASLPVQPNLRLLQVVQDR